MTVQQQSAVQQLCFVLTFFSFVVLTGISMTTISKKNYFHCQHYEKLKKASWLQSSLYCNSKNNCYDDAIQYFTGLLLTEAVLLLVLKTYCTLISPTSESPWRRFLFAKHLANCSSLVCAYSSSLH